MPFSNYIYEYYDDITTEKIVVGKWVRLIYEYIVSGLQDGLFLFNMTFCFTTDAGVLAPLNGRSFQVADVEFVKTYFPDFRLPGIAE